MSVHNRSPFAAVLFLDCVRELTLLEPHLPLARHYEAVVHGGEPLDPDPWPLFRDVVLTHREALADLLEHRAIQTNEVGRSAGLVPAFAVVAERFGRPLAVIEVGCSAGLNLFFDRFHIAYSDGRTAGPADAPVRLRCEVRGPLRPPLPDPAPTVVSRLGIDLNPVDITDPDAARWLESCIWPDGAHRVERFRAAAALARAEPPELWRRQRRRPGRPRHRGRAVRRGGLPRRHLGPGLLLRRGTPAAPRHPRSSRGGATPGLRHRRVRGQRPVAAGRRNDRRPPPTTPLPPSWAWAFGTTEPPIMPLWRGSSPT